MNSVIEAFDNLASETRREIEELEETVRLLNAEVERLKEDVRFWNETAIEYKRQLFETIRRGPESAGLHIITDEQIDAAWTDAWNMGYDTAAFAPLGIVGCFGCSGSGEVEVKGFGMFRCDDCNGHGWIIEERGDG
jgi:hypothetical protein